jgi:hypothetical protein
MEWTPLYLGGRGVQQERGGPPEPNGINVPEWSFDTSTLETEVGTARIAPPGRPVAWFCTRNDALGNIAVLLAAVGVFGAGAAWPDLIVAALLATLAMTRPSTYFVRHARNSERLVRSARAYRQCLKIERRRG